MRFASTTLPMVLKHSPVRVEFGASRLDRLGELAKSQGAAHVLLVTDPGVARAGHRDRAVASLREAKLDVTVFEGVRENPTTEHVDAGVKVAALADVDFLVGLGGGSSMDCAKGINLILTNGGAMADYWGEGKVSKPLLPWIAIPTTAGTGSEAQSFALIADPVTHQKMACGDRRLPQDGGLRPRVAILDPELTATQPQQVAVTSGIDAVSHAIETAATTRRNDVSAEATVEAWRRIESSFEAAIRQPSGEEARSAMLLGAHLAGLAIEHSMLGAAHACANPLTARFGITHGIAVGVMLPAVIRFNCADGRNPYACISDDPEALARRVEAMLSAAKLPQQLRDCADVLPEFAALAKDAATQWTAEFNPRPVSVVELIALYEAAW